MHISEMFRLVRGVRDILDVLDVLHERELTFDGLRAAAAAGRKGGRRRAVPAERVEEVRAAWLAGQSIASLARRHGVSRVAIRTAVADLLPDARPPATGPDLPVTMLIPGLIARRLAAVEQLDDAAAEALREGQEVRRVDGWTSCL